MASPLDTGHVDSDAAHRHRRVAEALEELDDPDPVVVAQHWAAAGDRTGFARWALRGADAARHGDDYATQLTLLRRVIREWEDGVGRANVVGATKTEVLLLCALAARFTGDGAYAVVCCDAVLRDDTASRLQRAGALTEKAAALAELGSPTAESVAWEAVALSQACPDSIDKAQQLAMGSATLANLKPSPEVARIAADAERMATAGGQDWIRSVTSNTHGCILTATDPDGAWEYFDRSRQAAERNESDQPRLLARYYLNATEALVVAGRYEDAISMAWEGDDYFERRSMGKSCGPLLAATAAEALLAAGQIDAASALVRRWLSRTLSARDRWWLLALQVEVFLAAGLTHEANDTYDVLREKMYGATVPDGLSALTAHLVASLALVNLPATDAADICLTAAVDAAAGDKTRAWPVMVLAARAIRLAGNERPPNWNALTDSLVAQIAPVHDSIGGRWRSLWDAEFASFDTLDTKAWERAATLFRASEGPVTTIADVLLRTSQAHAVAGNADSARRAWDDAQELIVRHRIRGQEDDLNATAQLLGVEKPRPEQSRMGLTRREFEVMRLLARGMPNRGIADTLYVSVRTVDVHVSRILGKLSVTTRGAAVAHAIAEGSLTPASSALRHTATAPTDVERCKSGRTVWGSPNGQASVWPDREAAVETYGGRRRAVGVLPMCQWVLPANRGGIGRQAATPHKEPRHHDHSPTRCRSARGSRPRCLPRNRRSVAHVAARPRARTVLPGS